MAERRMEDGGRREGRPRGRAGVRAGKCGGDLKMGGEDGRDGGGGGERERERERRKVSRWRVERWKRMHFQMEDGAN